jgi:cation transporter-like permease
MPVTSSLAGNVGCIFAARLATDFHRNVEENTSMRSRDNVIAMGSLFLISLPIHLAFLGFIHLLGAFKFGFLFLIAYLITGILSVLTTRL